MAVGNAQSPAGLPRAARGPRGGRRLAGPRSAVLAVLALTVAGRGRARDRRPTSRCSPTSSRPTGSRRPTASADVLSLLYSSGKIHHAEITPAAVVPGLMADDPRRQEPGVAAASSADRRERRRSRSSTCSGCGRSGAAPRCSPRRLTALSPFMIYYSAEARAYGLLMFFVAGSTLSLLLALDTGRRRWWIVYAICAAAAFYTHYTCLFVLAVQLCGCCGPSRGPGAPCCSRAPRGRARAPWIPGLIQDLRSPTVKILSALSRVHAERGPARHPALGARISVHASPVGLRETCRGRPRWCCWAWPRRWS